MCVVTEMIQQGVRALQPMCWQFVCWLLLLLGCMVEVCVRESCCMVVSAFVQRETVGCCVCGLHVLLSALKCDGPPAINPQAAARRLCWL
jgi:hypothetical protein